MAQTYPSREEVASIFKHVETGNFLEFMKYVSPNVDWTVMGTPRASHTQNPQLTTLGTQA